MNYYGSRCLRFGSFYYTRLKMLLFILLGFSLGYCTADSGNGNASAKPNLFEELDRMLRPDIIALIGLKSRGGSNFLPLESQQFKCRILNSLYRNAKISNPTFLNEMLTPTMMNMLENCSTRDFRVAEFFSQAPIFPGTLWCGQGNLAENFHDLGYFNQTDACCRDHDYCDDIIRPGKTKYNLANPYKITRLHCKCDTALRQCFRKVNTPIANTVGYIFFSLLQTQCYDLDFPASRCLLWRRGSIREYCVKYELDEDKPKMWQWFDQEPYL